MTENCQRYQNLRFNCDLGVLHAFESCFEGGEFKGVLCLHRNMDLPERLAAQLAGDEGPTRQKAARLVVDLAVTAEA